MLVKRDCGDTRRLCQRRIRTSPPRLGAAGPGDIKCRSNAQQTMVEFKQGLKAHAASCSDGPSRRSGPQLMRYEEQSERKKSEIETKGAAFNPNME